ncbi:MAG: hypothetical protein BGO87_06105 [Flavobacteriia bacterium 40-80]|nr:MAG: hypothetical protein BGO87_06105 [Flavobacteriia bacterium 40-80]
MEKRISLRYPFFCDMKILKLIFLLIAVLQLLSICYDWEAIRLLTKPLICTTLIGMVLIHRLKNNSLLILALAACLSGDVFLMLKGEEWFFIAGLASFLTGHLLYVLFFLKGRSSQYQKNKPLIITAVLTMTVIITFIAKELLPYVGELKVPVMIYMIVIGLMFVAATGRLDKRQPSHGLMLIAGAALFVISDTILAFNQFVSPISNGHFFVMITYMAAQYFLVSGSLAKEVN